jgi:glutathione synthase/RimK-type ligase-like ATP-grasp enzyme
LKKKVGIILPGDPNVKESLTNEKRNLHGLFTALEKENFQTQLFVYNDSIAGETEKKLLDMDIVLVWVNPIENGRDRSILDSILRRISNKGIIVSAHPDTIIKIGTKEVLFLTKELTWGSDVELYKTPDEMKVRLEEKFQLGVSRVLKQNRGNGGNGIWRIEPTKGGPMINPYVKVLHAQKNSSEEKMLLLEFIDEIKSYFNKDGQVIDQEFISPIPDGMIRCYITQDRVVGFGQQYVKALLLENENPNNDETTPRIYYSKEKLEYQDLRIKMEKDWIPGLLKLLNLAKKDLPILWDADFLIRQEGLKTKDKYALCEINVSSVFPFPETAITDLVETVKNILN